MDLEVFPLSSNSMGNAPKRYINVKLYKHNQLSQEFPENKHSQMCP